jgi:hypothetical protein
VVRCDDQTTPGGQALHERPKSRHC